MNFVLLITVAFTPLLKAIEGLGFEKLKVVFFTGSISLCLIIFFIMLFKSAKKIHVFSTPIQKSALIFVLAITLSSLFGIHPTTSAFGISPYYQGVFLYWLLFFFFLFVRLSGLPLFIWAYALTLSSCMVALVAIHEWVMLHVLSISIPTYAGRVVSTFGQPNLYSGFLLLVLPFSVFLLAEKKKILHLTALGSIIFSSLAIFLSESRASIFLLFLLFILYIFINRKRLKKIFYFFVFISIVVGLLFLSFTSSFVARFVERELLNPLNQRWVAKNAPEKRILIWQVAFEQGLKRSLFGYGLESFRSVYAEYFAQSKIKDDKAFMNRKNLVVDRAHNYLLDVFIYSGIIGVAAWGVLIVLLIVKARKKQVFLISIIIYVIWIQFQIQSIVHLMYFWLLVGLIDNKKNLKL